jgi:hypothetical protein
MSEFGGGDTFRHRSMVAAVGGVPAGVAVGARPGPEAVGVHRQRHRPSHHGQHQRTLRELGLLDQDQYEHDRGQPAGPEPAQEPDRDPAHPHAL